MSQAYTILDTSEGAAMLNVFHNEFGSEPWGNVYISDSTGSRYSPSLKYNRRKDTSCDFHKIKSMEGVYIANVIANYGEEACKKCKGFYDCIGKCQFASRITFDKGGQWMPLQAPVYDMNNKEIHCQKKIEGTNRCPLHLHGFASPGHSPIQSNKDAIGLIMAIGNSGKSLEPQNSGHVSVYYSRDAGVTWDEVIKGPHHYEISNYGGLMVVVPSRQFTNSMGFSWDEGKSWAWTNFTDIHTKVPVRRLRVSPNPLDRVMLLEIGDRKSVV